MNSDDIKKELMESIRNAKEPVIPKVFDDERLEDAFKVPIYDENGYSESSFGYSSLAQAIRICPKSWYISQSLVSLI